MTIDEAVGRILRRHWVLLVVIALLPVATWLAVSRPVTQYVSTAVVQVAGGPATSTTEADAMSTRVAGLATTRSFVVQALKEADAQRPLKEFTQKHIVTTRSGQSQVVGISVTDTEQNVASTVARSLARQVVTFMNKSDRPDTAALVKDLEAKRNDLLSQRVDLTAKISQSPLDPRTALWRSQLSVVEQQLAENAQSEQQLVIDQAIQPKSVVVDDGGRARRVPSELVQELALALVLGIALALMVVGGIEMVWPTVPGPRALGRLLDAPVIGRIRRSKRGDQGIPQTAEAVARTMRQQHLGTAVLVAAHPRQHVPAALPQRLAMVGAVAHGSAPVRWRTVDTIPPSEENESGVVVLMPSSVRRRDAEALRDLLRSTDWPVIGIVGTPGPRGPVRTAVRRFIRSFRRALRPTTVRRGTGRAPSSGSAPPEDAPPAASRSLLRCATVGLHVDVASDLHWVTSMLEEALAGDVLRVDPSAPPADLRVIVERSDKPFRVSGWQVVTRGVHTDGTRVVMQDACGTGFDLLAEPSGGRLTLRARWRPTVRSRAAARLLPSRFHLLVRCALLQYPALWWAGVNGRTLLHASAIRLGPPHTDVVALLAGPGGVGKSTLLATELVGGGQATADNICVVKTLPDGKVEVSGLLEPVRIEGAGGRRMPHGRGEQSWNGRATDLVATMLVVVSRGRQAEPVTRAATAEEAARALVGGTYAAGELRRYWPFAASLALGTGLGPVHPPIPEAARTVAEALPCTDLVLPSSRGTRLSDVLVPTETPR